MNTRKLIHFNEEKYNLTGDYTPFKCQQCKLNINEKIDKCFAPGGCYDKIQKEDYELKCRIDIRNALNCQKLMAETISRLNLILGIDSSLPPN